MLVAPHRRVSRQAVTSAVFRRPYQSLIKFTQKYANDPDACRDWFFNARFPNGWTCPECGCHQFKWIRGFQEQYPDVHFIFQQGDYSLIPEWIRSGKIDCGFISPAAAGELQYDIIKDGGMLAVLPENHPLASAPAITLSELAKEPFLELEEGSCSEIMDAFEKAGVLPDVKYRLHDDYAIMTMVEAGLGVSVLAKLILDRTSFRNVCIPLDPPIFRTLAIAYTSKESLPLASRRFIQYLLENKDRLP